MRRLRAWLPLVAIGTAFACAASCSPTPPPAPDYATRDAMLDPETCRSCHADHYRDWSGSMHAYAADDPVFLAMNRRGQRETGGALGGFCVQCHAPLALSEGATTDGLNLETVPKKLKGVTCFFCHTVDAVTGTHNNPLHLASGTVMKGPFDGALENGAHPSAYSSLHDRDRAESAKLCGACHDIQNGHDVKLERTYEEWQASVFSQPHGATCGQCHMDQSKAKVPVAAVPGAPLRYYHDHAQPGVDLATTPFPEADSQRTKVQSLLDGALQTAVCVGDGDAGIGVIIDNVAAGHSWPSGAAQDRRAWVEVIAYAGASVIYESGVFTDGADVTTQPDQDLWLLRDCMFDAQGKQVSMFWAAEKNESYLLPGQATFDPTDPRYYQTHVLRSFPAKGALSAAPDRVTARVRLEPVGGDVLADLAASGDLDPKVAESVPTLDVGSLVTWTAATATLGYAVGPTKFTCVTNTSLNFQAQTVPAPAHALCKP